MMMMNNIPRGIQGFQSARFMTSAVFRSILQNQQQHVVITTGTKFSQRSMSSSFLSSLPIIGGSPQTTSRHIQQTDIDHAVHFVKSHDPAGYLPGKLLPTTDMQIAYYAVRSFWVETGLRFGTTASVPPNSTPLVHLQWWQQEIEQIFASDNETSTTTTTTTTSSSPTHPTLRLLKQLQLQHNFTKCHFDDILKGRFRDLELKQYPTLDSLKEHALWSCGSLAQLVLESRGLYQSESSAPKAHEAAKLIGICHGLSNALRTSIPVISTTGKLIVPQDLCEKYGVKSPRYLLSALGQGDDKGIHALECAVQDIVMEARNVLQQARALRPEILAEQPKYGKDAVSVLLPGLASETFLDRLQEAKYNLTDRDLRNVGMMEHAMCASRMMISSIQHKY